MTQPKSDFVPKRHGCLVISQQQEHMNPLDYRIQDNPSKYPTQRRNFIHGSRRHHHNLKEWVKGT